MNKTRALFALAASLVAIATFIEQYLTRPAPHPDRVVLPAPVIPAPPPVPIAGNPSVNVAFGDVVRTTAGLSNAFIAADAPGEMFMRIALDAKSLQAARRGPVALAIVIDRSGSMDGDKIEKTREAAKKLVARLGDTDKLAIVSYATDYEVNLALSQVGRAGRDRIARIIDDLYVGGGTNLEAGMVAGLGEVKRAGKGIIKRVVLMSDGNANQGETDPQFFASMARKARRNGATITSLGVGVDFNEDMMTLIAKSAGGAYYYARDGSSIHEALNKEFAGMVALAARGVEIELNLAKFVRLQHVYGYTVENRAGNIIIPVGDMAAGEHREVLISLSSVAVGAQAHSVARVNVRYVSTADNTLRSGGESLTVIASRDATQVARGTQADVLEAAARVRAAQVRIDAAERFSEGNKDKARASLKAQINRTRKIAKQLKSAALKKQVVELEEAYDDINNVDYGSEAGRDAVKSLKHRAYELTR